MRRQVGGGKAKPWQSKGIGGKAARRWCVWLACLVGIPGLGPSSSGAICGTNTVLGWHQVGSPLLVLNADWAHEMRTGRGWADLSKDSGLVALAGLLAADSNGYQSFVSGKGCETDSRPISSYLFLSVPSLCFFSFWHRVDSANKPRGHGRRVEGVAAGTP